MAREIELKIPLTETQYKKLYDALIMQYKEIPGITVVSSSAEEVLKRDEYYSRYNTLEERRANKEPQVIRIRTESDSKESKTYFCLKRKQYIDGMEQNVEEETFIEDVTPLRSFFAEAGYFCWFDKNKRAYGAYCTTTETGELPFHLELVTVNGLKYAEIEVTSETQSPKEVFAALESFVKKMGLNLEDKDPRSWYTICTGNN